MVYILWLEMKMDEELINRVEAVLFSSGKKVTVEDIQRLCRIKNEKDIETAIAELKKRHCDNTSLMIVDEGRAWKMTIREKYLHFIRKIVTEAELSKTLMETLAVVAWKNPAFQSDIIKIRTNKAYDHLKQLEEAGFIDSAKHGRTRLLKLSKKFYEYFDLKGDKDIKEVFGTIKEPKLPQTKMSDFEEKTEIETYDIPKEDDNEKVEIVDEPADEIEKELEIIEDDSASEMPEMQEQDEIPKQNNDTGKEE